MGLRSARASSKRRMSATEGMLVNDGNIQYLRKVCEATGISSTSEGERTTSAAEHEHGGTGWSDIKV